MTAECDGKIHVHTLPSIPRYSRKNCHRCRGIPTTSVPIPRLTRVFIPFPTNTRKNTAGKFPCRSPELKELRTNVWHCWRVGLFLQHQRPLLICCFVHLCCVFCVFFQKAERWCEHHCRGFKFCDSFHIYGRRISQYFKDSKAKKHFMETFILIRIISFMSRTIMACV